jgi:hypothetical protein
MQGEGVGILSRGKKKTCRKLGISFWEYLTDRVCGKNVIPTLGELIAQKAQSLGSLADIASSSVA